MKKNTTILNKSGVFMRKVIAGLKLPLLLLALFTGSFGRISAQIPTFQKIYPNSVNRSGTGVMPTSDGGYIVVGSTEDNIQNDLDVIIMKTDAYGDTLWQKIYGRARPDYPNNIVATSDGNFMIVGGTQSFGGGDLDIYVIKINPAGDTLWTKAYGGYGNEDGNEIIATSDGNYLIVGESNSVNFSNYDVRLTKIDASGNQLWVKYYGDANYQSGHSVKECSDGGFIIAAKTAATYSSVASIYLVRTNSSADTLWTKVYSGGSGHSYEGKSIVVNNDGSYTMSADDSSGASDSDVRIMKFDPSGGMLWTKLYGGTKKDITKMIQHTSDGGYVVACISRSFGWINPDMWMLKLDAAGDTMWTRHFGGSGHEHCYAAKQTADGGYILVGHSKSYTPNTEIMLVKVDASGNFNSNTTHVQQFFATGGLNVYPNPSAGRVLSIDLDDELTASVLKIRNGAGQEVFSQNIDPGSGKNRKLDLGERPSGIYFVTLQSATQVTTRKLILE